jgi:putative SbcD/Mre11-related phosphoesterase
VKVHDEWLLTPERAAVHLPTRTAVIADLHLGYDRVRCRGGEALPAFGIDDVIAALEAVVTRNAVRRLVIAGDLCEDGRSPQTVAEMVNWLRHMEVELAVVPGNHDRDLHKAGFDFPVSPRGVEVGDWLAVHGEGNLPRGRVIHGHVHPCVRCGARISAPCYLVGKHRIILPAFSPDAAGVNSLRDRRWARYHCLVPVGKRVLNLGLVAGINNMQAGRQLGQRKKGSGIRSCGQ